MASVRVRQEFAAISTISSRCHVAGLDKVGLPISSDPSNRSLDLTKQHGAGPIKDAIAWRYASRRFAVCPRWRSRTGTGDHGGTATGPHRWGSSLTNAKAPDAGGAASPRTACAVDETRVTSRSSHLQRSLRSIKHHLPSQWYKEVKESLSQRHEVSPTQATAVGNQVQNPVKDRTPI